MAIWQYSFMIVPKEELDAMGCSDSITKEKYFAFHFWQSEYKVCDYEVLLNEILLKGKSWSSEITLFGKEDSDNIEIVSEDGIVIEMCFRFDFNRKDIAVLDKVIEFCIYNGLALIAEDFSIVSLNLEVIMSTIMDSDQYVRFLELQGKIR